MRKRKGKEPDPKIERVKMGINGLKNKPDQVLIRIEENLIDVNKNLKEIIRLLKIKH
jgi:hypothetical protein